MHTSGTRVERVERYYAHAASLKGSVKLLGFPRHISLMAKAMDI